MDERLRRFKDCDHRLYPYIDKVLKRLPEEVKEQVLSDSSFQFVSMYENISRFCLFNTSTRSMAILKEKILMLPEYECLFTIAYKIAQYYTEKGEITSWREKLEEQLVTWGFEKERELVKYHRSLYESIEFDIGYLWAKEKEDKFMWVVYGDCLAHLTAWDYGTLSEGQWDTLFKSLKPKEVMYKIGWIPKIIQPDKTDPQGGMSDTLAKRAVVYGIMSRLKEIKLGKEEGGEIKQNF